MTQITTLEALAGKTIEQTHCFGDSVVLVLVGGDWLYLRAGIGRDGDSYSLDWSDQPTLGQMLCTGLISQEEHDRIQAARKAKWEADRAADDRREYERLRAKFEGEGVMR